MHIVSKCLQCGRGYTAQVTTCQICGGGCAPFDPNDTSVILPRTEPVADALRPTCPCCGGDPGPHTIAQQTRHLKGISWFPAKRTYLVTTVKIPGVCVSCHRTIAWKRALAGVLMPLPLFVFFGLLVIADSPVFLLPVLIYLVYLAGQFTYTWVDFLLYGRALAWQLVDYVPKEDRESFQRYPGGIGQLLFRLGFYPVLFAIFAAFVQLGIIVKPPVKTAKPAIAKVEVAPVPAPAPVAPRVPAPAAPTQVARPKTPVEEALRIFKMTPLFAVPVDSETLADPKLGHPATSPTLVGRKLIKVVWIYYDEAKVPPGTAYQLMNGPTALANFATVKSDGLKIGNGQIFLTPAEVAELAAQITGAVAPPSPVKVGAAH